MEKKSFIGTSLFLLILFASCKQAESNSNGQVSNNNCTINTKQFFELTGAEDSVVMKILPHCFKIDNRGDFREFTYYISIYDSSKTEYYDQFSITTDHNNRSVYYTTSNQKNYDSYKKWTDEFGF